MHEFKVNPNDRHKEFPICRTHWSWIFGPLLAEASNIGGFGTPELRQAERDLWLKQSTSRPAHFMVGHNQALQWARNTAPVMETMCGPGGYETWQHGMPGTGGVGRGLYMGMEVTFHAPMPCVGFGEIRHRLNGIFASGPNAFVRHRSEIVGADGAHYQTVEIMCRVAGTAPEGLEKPPQVKFAMPGRPADHSETHSLAGRGTVFRWATAAEDPNLRHIDEQDPRVHGPCAISILTHAVLRRFCDSDTTRLRRISVPGFFNPFYQEDDLRVDLWQHEGRIVGQLHRLKGDPERRRVLDMVEVDIAG
jgi:hypothetical protein